MGQIINRLKAQKPHIIGLAAKEDQEDVWTRKRDRLGSCVTMLSVRKKISRAVMAVAKSLAAHGAAPQNCVMAGV